MLPTITFDKNILVNYIIRCYDTVPYILVTPFTVHGHKFYPEFCSFCPNITYQTMPMAEIDVFKEQQIILSFRESVSSNCCI